ncbi:(2Fe-2S) ferredoxin domain-containing protein [Paenibacillus sp. YPG26]|uniref:(2Fe-2S) ferredoxin domain-containing protein n=1 Tax=Paenibacillus sp. YPG26 TaxID=2878915 RepID=UPI00203EDA05|nr:(2Fe-2S) ferredoxin domain-containing protein [Paenibacillus sp. YPG26]USB32187.1 (2Fe-2S) ferredoxin domain-containing protein [Paenibacillus sp. YPG26]
MGNYNLDKMQHHILICHGSSCKRNRAEEITSAIRGEINLLKAGSILVTRTECLKRCSDACNAAVYPEGIWYKEMTPKAGRKLVRKLKKGKLMKKHISYHITNNKEAT